MIIRVIFAALVALSFIQVETYAQDFEGVYRQRTIQVSSDATYEVLGEAIYEGPEQIVNRLVDVSSDEVLGASDADIESLVVFVKGSFMRAQQDLPGEPQGYQISDMAAGATWMVNVPERTYLEFTQEDAERMAAQAQEMMGEMGIDQEQLEEYKAAMEEERSDTESQSRPLGRSADVNGVSATAHAYADDQEVVVGWCAPDEKGFVAAMKQLIETSPMADEEQSVKDWLCPDASLVVRSLRYDVYSGDLEVDELLSVSRESVSDELFKVPAGFKKQSYPGFPEGE